MSDCENHRDENDTPDPADVPGITGGQIRDLQARIRVTTREPLLPEGELTQCAICGGEMVTTNNLQKSISTPHGLTVITRLPGAHCTRCSAAQFDAAATALILEHSEHERRS